MLKWFGNIVWKIQLLWSLVSISMGSRFFTLLSYSNYTLMVDSIMLEQAPTKKEIDYIQDWVTK